MHAFFEHPARVFSVCVHPPHYTNAGLLAAQNNPTQLQAFWPPKMTAKVVIMSPTRENAPYLKRERIGRN